MKTTNNHNSAVKMATVLFAVVIFSTTAWAQQKTGADNSSVNEAVERLEVLANKVEKEIRYEAPSVETTDYIEPMARLEMLATKIENEIRYIAPEAGQINAVEFAADENNAEKENNELLTLNSDPSK